jgi:Helix-turn-helix domain
MPTDEIWLDISELSARLNIPVETLRDWRKRRYGPPGVRFGPGRGGSVRYRLSAVERWEAEQERAQASDGAA